MSDSEKTRNGPLFLVGPPRSGTKLLKNILNASPEISIGPESHIFPKLLQRFGDKKVQEQHLEIFDMLSASNYFERLQRNGFYKELLPLIDQSRTIEEFIFRLMEAVSDWEGKEEAVWLGDKTPNYIRWTELFRERFPNARFIAIVRDPRDQALSVRKTWGKDPLLAAERWAKDVRAFEEASSEAPSSYFRLRYEDLLEDPEERVKEICTFLGIELEKEMLDVNSSERYGAGKGVTGVLQGNQEKYLEHLRPRRIRRIEEITLPELKAWGYPVHYAKDRVPVGKVYRKLASYEDGLRNLLFHIRSKGIRRGFRYMISIRRDKLK